MSPDLLTPVTTFDLIGSTDEIIGISPDAELALARTPGAHFSAYVVNFSGSLCATVEQSGTVIKAALSSDGREILTAAASSDGSNRLHLYGIDASQPAAVPAGTLAMAGLADAEWLPDGSVVAAGHTDGLVWTVVSRPGDPAGPVVALAHFPEVRELRCMTGCIAVWWRADEHDWHGRISTYPLESGPGGGRVARRPLLTIDNPRPGAMALISADGRHAIDPLADALWSADATGGEPRQGRAGESGMRAVVGGNCIAFKGWGRTSGSVDFRHLSVDGSMPWGGSWHVGKVDALRIAVATGGTFVAVRQGTTVRVVRLTDADILSMYDTDDSTSNAAVSRVGTRRLDAAVPHLAQLVRQRPTVAAAAVQALERIGSDSAHEALLQAGPDEPHAQDVLLRMEAARLTDMIRCALGRRHRAAVRAAARLLVRRTDPVMVEELCALLEDREPAVRADAAAALAARADPGTLPALVAAIGDPNDQVARHAWHATLATLPSGPLESVWPDSEVLTATGPYLASVIRTGLTASPSDDAGAARVIKAIAARLVHPPYGADQVLNALTRLGHGGRHREAAIVLCMLAAQRAADRGEGDTARAFWFQAAADAVTADAPEVVWRAHMAVGDLFATAQQWRAAEGSYAAAERVIDRMWARLLGAPNDRHFFAGKAHLYEQAMLCRLRLGRAACALDTLEKAKTRYLGDLIARRHSRPDAALTRTSEEFWRESGQRRPLFNGGTSAPSGDADIAGSEIVDVTLDPPATPDETLPAGLAALTDALGRTIDRDPPPPIIMVRDIWTVAALLHSGGYRSSSANEVRDAVGDLDDALTELRAVVDNGDRDGSQSAVQRCRDAAAALSRVTAAAGPPPWSDDVSTPAPGWTLREFRGWERDFVTGRSAVAENLATALHEATAFVTGRTAVWTRGPRTAREARTDADSLQHSARTARTSLEPNPAGSPFAAAGPFFTAATPGTSAGAAGHITPHPTATTALETRQHPRWQYAIRIARGETVGTAEAARLLLRAPGTAVVEFALTRSGTVIYAIAEGADLNNSPLPRTTGWAAPTVFTVPEVTSLDLEQRIFGPAGWMHAYGRRATDEHSWKRTTDDCLRWLYGALFRPLTPWLKVHGITKLLIVPHRALHLLPVSAWYDRRGRRRRYVSDRFDVSYTPSLTLLDICRQRADATDTTVPRRPLVLLDPTRDLPMARLDALAVRPAPAANRILAGSRATTDRWIRAAADANPCHYAGHAGYRRDDPLESRIELADGALTLGNLFDGRVPVPAGADIALSGCETAMSDHQNPADEYLGIASGFLFAGAATVLSTQWAIADEPASLLVDRFYAQLRNTNPPRALRNAQRALRGASRSDLYQLIDRASRQANSEILDAHARQRLAAKRSALRNAEIDYAHPVHWAAYTLTGSGLSPLPEH
ncbi:hypothetical protein Val02_85590 [Virgisporangium aliadipatigenens]|uniref:CHAT domain-containing protein n=1 Tax=Virgisporangium aliadipatigenens TaxID=741659 RepID=A0A8J4DVZ3_9ACTN|nr:CHAT domain-containing protein [Virgisporangium aliadipatigenens]GIJ51673.1 hypothetical protein Val02_85590 [Virgisporangium aliadipatigenens]